MSAVNRDSMSETQVMLNIHDRLGGIESTLKAQNDQIGAIFSRLKDVPTNGNCIQGERNANSIKALAWAGSMVTTAFFAVVTYFHLRKDI